MLYLNLLTNPLLFTILQCSHGYDISALLQEKKEKGDCESGFLHIMLDHIIVMVLTRSVLLSI